MKCSAIDTPKKTCYSGSIFAAAVILALGIGLGWRSLQLYPQGIHAWSQADWYSIAIGFRHNNYDFFHPETLIYNKQYPGYWMQDAGDCVTSVDFPLHPYIVALLMELFGTTAPWVFRGWTWVCSLAGMWFLYLLARRLTGSTLKSTAVVCIAMTSPLYAYYFASYLPTAPAMACVTAGLWAYVRYRQDGKNRYWHLAIGMLTVGALTRTSQAVPLVAVLCFEALRIIRRETTLRGKVPAAAISVATLVAYLFWNAHLRTQHGSLFLNELVPARSADAAHDVYRHIKGYWKFRYFSQLQHWLIAVTAVAGIAVACLTGKKKKEMRKKESRLLTLALIWLFGEALFCAAMLTQFSNHDYYFLDSLYLPILFLLTLSAGVLPHPRGWTVAIAWVALIMLGGTMFNYSKHSLRNSHVDGDRSLLCLENYRDADRWLDTQGVPRDARITALGSYPQNLPFILMGRRGYSAMWMEEWMERSVLQFPADYIVMEDTIAREYLDAHSSSLGRLERLAGNGKISLYKQQ